MIGIALSVKLNVGLEGSDGTDVDEDDDDNVDASLLSFRLVTVGSVERDAFVAAPLSNWRRICHIEVVLANFPVSRVPPVSRPSSGGSCSATDTTEGERDACTSSSWAWFGRPDRRKARERSSGFPLCLRITSDNAGH